MVVVGCDCDWEEEEVAVEDLLACLVKARQEAAEVQRRHLVRTKRGKLAFLVLVLFHDILGKGGFGGRTVSHLYRGRRRWGALLASGLFRLLWVLAGGLGLLGLVPLPLCLFASLLLCRVGDRT